MNIKIIIFLLIFLLILIFLYWNNWNNKNSEAYDGRYRKYIVGNDSLKTIGSDTYNTLKTMVSKKFYDIGTIYQTPTKNLMVNLGINIGQLIENDVLDKFGLSEFSNSILNKYLNFSSNLDIQNLSLGIYTVPQLTLSAIENNITFSGSITLKLKMDQFSLNNINIFGINVGNFNINNLDFEVFTKLTIKMSASMDEINTTVNFETPQIMIPPDLLTQFISNIASNLTFQFNCPSCNGCGSWYHLECWAKYAVCEAERQSCLAANYIERKAYILSDKGILSFILGEVPKVINSLINNGISSALIAEIINDIPAISSAIGTIFEGDQNIKNTVSSLGASKVDCELSNWSPWSACSGGSCPVYDQGFYISGGNGLGTQTRTATVLAPPLNGGKCITSQTQQCNLNCAPPEIYSGINPALTTGFGLGDPSLITSGGFGDPSLTTDAGFGDQTSSWNLPM
jgi:hypothetical protein